MTHTSEPSAAEPDDSIDDAAPAEAALVEAVVGTPAPATQRVRKRPKPGERRVQILHTLASMLEQPGADRVTTAALAASSMCRRPRCTATSRARRRCSRA